MDDQELFELVSAGNLLPAIFIAPLSIAFMDALGIPYYPQL